MKIPFVDLSVIHQSLQKELEAVIAAVISESAFIGTHNNRFVKSFEDDFRKYLGVSNAIACANGTDAIEILLQALGIGPGDEVIVPAHTWISTAEAVCNVGAKPVFVDTEPDFHTINPALIEAAISNRTRAIIPVHLFGHPADMEPILAIAKKYKVKVIEDCAQAHGAKYNGKMVGTFGDAASFSFFPGKNLGAFGDAGAMVTNNPEIAERTRLIGQHGQKIKHKHLLIGRNSRMDGLQAAVLSVKLKYLDEWNNERNRIADEYLNYFRKFESSVVLPKTRKNSRHVFHIFAIELERRNEALDFLKDRGVSAAVHYPLALTEMSVFKSANPNNTPNAVAKTKRLLSLPIFPGLAEEQKQHIFSVFEKFIKEQ